MALVHAWQGDAVLTVKANQPTLYDDLETYFANPEACFDQACTTDARNFTERGELGAACTIYYRGEKVVDLWGGYRDPHKTLPWQEDTMVLVFSSTKGLAGLTMALAHSRGLFEYDAPIASYWPEFAQNGKGHITVRQLLAHEAGISKLVIFRKHLALAQVQTSLTLILIPNTSGHLFHKYSG